MEVGLRHVLRDGGEDGLVAETGFSLLFGDVAATTGLHHVRYEL